MDSFYNKLKISKEEFLFQYQSHPNYPSILAFSDTLNFLSIKNEAYEIDKENWHELPEKFITIYNDKFTIIEKSNDEYLIFNDKTDKISKEKLHTDSENIVFLFDEIDNVNDVKKINYKWIISSFFALIFIYSYLQFNQYLFIYNVFTMIGLYLSLELFNNKFGVKSNIVNTLCSSNNVESSNTKNSCNKIFDSDKIFFLGLKLSDFSLVYFLGLLVLGILIKENIFLLKHISFLSGLVIFYSLYVQVFVEKTICKICLLIVFSLIGQIVISLLFFEIKYNKDILFPSILIFALSFLLIIYLNDILKKNQKYYEISLKNIRFKKNYDIFKKELVVKQYSFNHKSKEFWIGSKESKLNISLITNPYCGYCKEAHLILKKIIEKYPEISFQLRFNYFAGNTDENLTLLISTFRNIHKDQGEKGLLDAIEFWHNKNDVEIFKKKYKTFIYKTEMDDIIKMAEENRNFALTYTPQILINNYLFPSLYERDDIFYFIDELLEDEEILNERL